MEQRPKYEYEGEEMSAYEDESDNEYISERGKWPFGLLQYVDGDGDEIWTEYEFEEGGY